MEVRVVTFPQTRVARLTHQGPPEAEHATARRLVAANPYGIEETSIPACRCALARDVGSRMNNPAVVWLFEHWPPCSGETFSGDPLIFHYVNVGPSLKEEEAITDVYLPLA